MGAGDGLGHGGQGFVDLAIEFETMAQDLDAQHLAFVPTGEDGAGKGQGRLNSPVDLPVFLR